MRPTTEDLKLANLQKLVKDVEALLSGVTIQEPPDLVPRNGSYKIRVDRDRMTAWLELYPPISGGAFVDVPEVLLALEQERLEVDRTLVAFLVERCNNGETIVEEKAVVLRGTPPTPPTPPSISFLCPMERTRSYDTDTKQAVDWKNMWSNPLVAKGDSIALVTSPVQGSDGVDVFGVSIPAVPTKELGIVYGPNVEIVSEGDSLRILSRIDGQPSFDGRVLDVVAVLNVKGDVGMQTGDIDFPGAVVVSGSVQQGFRIKATGNVEISGSVLNAKVFCGGVCLVKGGLIGDQSVIRADNGATVGFVEYGTVIAAGNINIQGYSLFATLKSRDTVFVLGKNQRGVVGGLVMARNLIELFGAGSALEPVTQLQAGADPFVQEWLRDIVARKKETEELKGRVELALASMKTMTQGFRQDLMSVDDRKTVLTLAQHHAKLEKTLSELQSAEEELERRRPLEDGVVLPKVRIREKVYPNVTIRIFDHTMVIRKTEMFSSFVLDKDGSTIVREAFK